MNLNALSYSAPLRVLPGLAKARFGSAQLTEEDYKALAAQTKKEQRGQGIRGRVTFTLETTHALTSEDAGKIQKLRGYDPRGYDFFDFAQTDLPGGAKQYTWQCSTSCD